MAKAIKPKPPKPKKCKCCPEKFIPRTTTQTVCSTKCAIQLAGQISERKKQREEKIARAEWRARKAALKPLKHWIDLTQRAVNDICREEALAKGEGCISCGTHNANAWHAGHYRTTAAAGHLRFTRININLQCDQCNIHKSGNIEAYRINLVQKYGAEIVHALECDNETHRWTVEELQQIRMQALADLRALKKQQEVAA